MTHALITGASKGIGKEMAIALAERKMNLLLVARSENLLKELKDSVAAKYGVDVQYKAIDLTSTTATNEIVAWINTNKFEVDILINNAGYGLWGSFESLTLEEQLNMLELNTLFPVKLTHQLLPVLKQQPKAYILNVASLAAYQAVAYLGVYSASKSFLVSFSRALSWELKDSNVRVTCLSPGGVDTFFMDRARMTSKRLQAANAKVSMSPKDVAEYGIKKMLEGKPEVIPGFVNQLSYCLIKFLPKSIVEGLAFNLYKP